MDSVLECILVLFNDTATTEIYTLSLHDALPIYVVRFTLNTALTPDDVAFIVPGQSTLLDGVDRLGSPDSITNSRSEEHTPELQSRHYLVCRLLLATNDYTTS